MSGRHRPGRPRRIGTTARLAGVALAVTGVVAAAVLLGSGPSAPVRPSAATTGAAATTVPPATLETAPAPTTAVPIAVDMPTIGVQSSLIGLQTDATGALVPPEDFAQAGWFDQGTVPGEVGPAVIAGHVDSVDGPAVFYHLEDLAVGDQVRVTRDDGQVFVFAVTQVAEYPKSDFPTELVYGPTAAPELRLITCGGVFDHSRRSYVDNIVVYASLVS